MPGIKERWSIVITVYDQYEMFRQLFESILYHVSTQEVIVVDDYSYPLGKLRAYEDYIENKYNAIRVIKSDLNEYRVSFHCNDTDKALDAKINSERGMDMSYTNMGHAYAAQIGIDAVKTEFVLVLDADCVMMERSKTLLAELAEMFDSYPGCMCTGQVAGVMSDEIKEIPNAFNFSYVGKNNTEGGCPGSPAVACRMSGWRDHGLEPLAVGPRRVGWAFAWYTHDVFRKGFTVVNFPILSGKHVFHVGGGIFSFIRAGRRKENKLGMCKDVMKYGGRVGYDTMNEWYHGRYVLNMDSHDYIRLLRERYAAPFEQIQPPLDENLLHIAKNEIKPQIGSPIYHR